MVVLVQSSSPDFTPLDRQALLHREQEFGQEARKTAEGARDLALYLAGRSDYAGAELYLDRPVTLADTPAAATALHNWAVALEERNALQAERLYKKAPGIRVNSLPALDIELATTRLNLAGLLLATGVGEAGQLSQAALTAFEKQLGPNDARTAAACGIVATVFATQGDVARAERLFGRALAIAEKAHGTRAMETANALENLADLLAQTGRELAARPLSVRRPKRKPGGGQSDWCCRAGKRV